MAVELTPEILADTDAALDAELAACRCEDGHRYLWEGANILPPHTHEGDAVYVVPRPTYQAPKERGTLLVAHGDLRLCAPCARLYAERSYRVEVLA